MNRLKALFIFIVFVIPLNLIYSSENTEGKKIPVNITLNVSWEDSNIKCHHTNTVKCKRCKGEGHLNLTVKAEIDPDSDIRVDGTCQFEYLDRRYCPIDGEDYRKIGEIDKICKMGMRRTVSNDFDLIEAKGVLYKNYDGSAETKNKMQTIMNMDLISQYNKINKIVNNRNNYIINVAIPFKISDKSTGETKDTAVQILIDSSGKSGAHTVYWDQPGQNVGWSIHVVDIDSLNGGSNWDHQHVSDGETRKVKYNITWSFEPKDIVQILVHPNQLDKDGDRNIVMECNLQKLQGQDFDICWNIDKIYGETGKKTGSGRFIGFKKFNDKVDFSGKSKQELVDDNDNLQYYTEVKIEHNEEFPHLWQVTKITLYGIKKILRPVPDAYVLEDKIPKNEIEKTVKDLESYAQIYENATNVGNWQDKIEKWVDGITETHENSHLYDCQKWFIERWTEKDGFEEKLKKYLEDEIIDNHNNDLEDLQKKAGKFLSDKIKEMYNKSPSEKGYYNDEDTAYKEGAKVFRDKIKVLLDMLKE